MTKLSTQAQAIIDAADEVFSHGGTIREGFAAALRVLADNVAPENYACFCLNNGKIIALDPVVQFVMM